MGGPGHSLWLQSRSGGQGEVGEFGAIAKSPIDLRSDVAGEGD